MATTDRIVMVKENQGLKWETSPMALFVMESRISHVWSIEILAFHLTLSLTPPENIPIASTGPHAKVTFSLPKDAPIRSPPSNVINSATVTKPGKRAKSVTLDSTFDKSSSHAGIAIDLLKNPPAGPRARSAPNYLEIHSEFDALSPEERSRFTSDSDAALSSPRRQTVTVNKSQVSDEASVGSSFVHVCPRRNW